MYGLTARSKQQCELMADIHSIICFMTKLWHYNDSPLPWHNPLSPPMSRSSNSTCTAFRAKECKECTPLHRSQWQLTTTISCLSDHRLFIYLFIGSTSRRFRSKISEKHLRSSNVTLFGAFPPGFGKLRNCFSLLTPRPMVRRPGTISFKRPYQVNG